MRKARGTLIFLLVVLPIIIWLALGPGARVLLNSNSRTIIGEIKQRSDNHILVSSVSGDFWTGVVLHNVVIYADDDPDHLPILDADTVVLRYSFANIFSYDFTPRRILISGFNSALHIDEDGKVALPKWKFRTASARRTLVAGFVAAGQNKPDITISCERGVLEIHKRYPRLTEPVNLSITQLAGTGRYSSTDGLAIESINGDYLSTPVTVRGEIPGNAARAMHLAANLGDLQLSTLFNDVDPLFRGSTYLPNGTITCELSLTGSRDLPEITAKINLRNGTIGNMSVDKAEASIAYSAGVIDLTGINAQCYGGTFDGTGRINLLSQTPRWDMDGDFSDINLGQYLASNGYYAYEINGSFSGTAQASGDFKNRNALVCRATITSSGGTYLSPFSERFMQMSQGTTPDGPASQSDMATYDNAAIELAVENSLINVNRFHLASYELNVDAHGPIGFDKSISVSGELSVPLAKARQNRKLGRFVALLPDSMDRAELSFRLTGHLNNVQFDAQPTMNLLRGLADQGGDLFHGLGGALGGRPNPDN